MVEKLSTGGALFFPWLSSEGNSLLSILKIKD